MMNAGCDSGARVAAALIGLGRLQGPNDEILLLETGDFSCKAVSSSAPAHFEQTHFVQTTHEEELPGEVTVEDDLVVCEFDFHEELISSSVTSSIGTKAARRLMQGRAQQCVVCMEEKEHTFVPPHETGEGQQVHGHRFCSECWIDFLEHSLRHQPSGKARGSSAPPPLSCPVCRGIVTVPDVWGVGFELPRSWLHASRVHEIDSEIATLTDAPGVLVPLTWVDAAVVYASDVDVADEDALEESVCRRVCNTVVYSTANCFRGVVEHASQAAMMDMSVFDSTRAIPF